MSVSSPRGERSSRTPRATYRRAAGSHETGRTGGRRWTFSTFTMTLPEGRAARVWGTTGLSWTSWAMRSWAANPPSGTFYDPEHDGTRLSSLGVHEHWNNPVAKLHGRNLGLDEGIELVARRVDRPQPRIHFSVGNGAVRLAWQESLGCRLEFRASLEDEPGWRPVPQTPAYERGYDIVTERFDRSKVFYRLVRVL